MTAIVTLISDRCTAHAPDSFITRRSKQGELDVEESQRSKLIKVEHWRGIMAYWGFARNGFDTVSWLRNRSKTAGKSASPAQFAQDCASELTNELSRRTFANPVDSGLGIHFTAYEHINGYWIPELFVLSRWTDESYATVLPDYAFRVTRETYATWKSINPPKGRELDQPQERRLEIHEALRSGLILFYNNGDPVVVNPIITVTLHAFGQLKQRAELKDMRTVAAHLSMARRPVEYASHLLADLTKPGMRRIGGRPHELAVNPDGRYTSTTGD